MGSQPPKGRRENPHINCSPATSEVDILQLAIKSDLESQGLVWKIKSINKLEIIIIINDNDLKS